MLYTCILLKLTRIIFNSMLISWCIFLSLGSKQRRTEAADGRRWRWWLWTPCKLKKKHHHLIFTRNRLKKNTAAARFSNSGFWSSVLLFVLCHPPNYTHAPRGWNRREAVDTACDRRRSKMKIETIWHDFLYVNGKWTFFYNEFVLNPDNSIKYI